MSPAPLWRRLSYCVGTNESVSHIVFLISASADHRRAIMTRHKLIGVFSALTLVVTVTMSANAQDTSKYPDWSGQWMRGPGMGVGWDPSKPPGLGQQAPLTPE